MDEFYVAFLDIDGTVYCGGEISEANRRAVAAARAAGHKVYINTARPMADIPEAVRQIQWDGYVAAVGSIVIAEGERLLSACIPPQELADVFDEMTGAGYPMRVESEQILLANRFFPQPNECIRIDSGVQLLEEYGGEKFSKAFLPCVLPKPVRRRLAKQFQFFQHHSYAEFSVLGLTKATGMQVVLDAYGADKSRCIAMGDSINDVDMLRAAGIAVAMGNAAPEVKAVCDYISRPGKEDGVAHALIDLLHLPQ